MRMIQKRPRIFACMQKAAHIMNPYCYHLSRMLKTDFWIQPNPLVCFWFRKTISGDPNWMEKALAREVTICPVGHFAKLNYPPLSHEHRGNGVWGY